MSDTQRLQPGKDHPITVTPGDTRVIVTRAGTTIADSIEALVLREAAYPDVMYLPRADVRMDLLERTDHTTHCPYKGDASYYSISGAGDESANAVWTYEAPYDAVAPIRDHLAFYPDEVDIELRTAGA
ncbi:DUF427 domain-containing protein [Leekyejoonella antrihumi]|uniref:DUF427 domain-containing protein n=1 Tax=Leekyejoonella antrihumi TaxID=1660198 RepID=A0A563E3Z7_9MICO|nr:DUF427 domain-containing protein [Leekyejoonella antrihumi]TWP36952.1 DUF427 domain-containing protein [Leekyejoonella antrihumi]